MPRTDTRVAAVAVSIAATLAIAAPAAARTTLLDDDAPVLRRALAAGLQVSGDDLLQIRVGQAVFGPGREVESVPASSLLGRSPSGMAAALRKAVADASGHSAIIDEIGAAFRGADGDALAAANTSLAGEPSPYAGGGTIAGRVQIYLASAGHVSHSADVQPRVFIQRPPERPSAVRSRSVAGSERSGPPSDAR